MRMPTTHLATTCDNSQHQALHIHTVTDPTLSLDGGGGTLVSAGEAGGFGAGSQRDDHRVSMEPRLRFERDLESSREGSRCHAEPSSRAMIDIRDARSSSWKGERRGKGKGEVRER